MNNKLRLFLLTLLTVFVSGASFAGDKFTVILDNGATQSTSNYFTIKSDGGYNSKYTGIYEGREYKKGLKLNSASKIEFKSEATSTVLIVQSLTANSNKTFKFDGQEVTNDKGVDNATDKVRVYTFENVEAGSHSFTHSGETGILFVSVEYTGATLKTLATPTISFDSATGEVTISEVTNANSIVYTTDGSDPSADNGETYADPFNVEDGTTVKAIALGDGETYANSEIAAVEVLLEITSVAAPTFKVVYGTVAIASETPKATIEYSTDGENFTEYTGPVTLLEDGTIYARASRDEIVSDVASVEVTAVSKGDATNTIVLTFDAFAEPATIDGFSTLVGKDAAEGYSLVLTGNSGKAYSAGGRVNDQASIKLSNGAENTLVLPSGVSATRISIYSYQNVTAQGRESGWASVADVETNYQDVPMAALSTGGYDLRVYPLTGEETEIKFKNAGEQLCFYIVLDVVENKAGLDAAYDPEEINMIEGEEFVAPTLTITDEAGEAVEGLTITYTSSNEEVATVDAEGNIAIVGAGSATITAKTEATDEYRSATATVKITVTPADQVLVVTENPTDVVLTKDLIAEKGYLSTTTENWSNRKYGEIEADFFNMSATNRKLSIVEKGAIAFEVLVQNSNAGRSYDLTVDGTTTTIEHNGTGIESSGIIECSSDQITITLGGTGIGSVYPLAIKFYTELPISVNISNAQYATLYYGDKALVVPSDVKAYTIGRIDSKNVVKKGTEYAAGETIPAGEAVVLEGKPGTYSFVIDNESTAAPTEGNLLKGSDEAAETTGGDKYYMLSTKEGVVGFYYGAEEGAAFTNGAHKAYLAVSGAAAAANYFVFDGEATGINAVSKVVANNGKVYNLQGIEMNADNLTKGIYVINGKKVVIK